MAGMAPCEERSREDKREPERMRRTAKSLWLWVTFIVALVAATADEAHAVPGVVVVGGSAAEDQRAAVTAALARVTREAGWSTPARAITAAESQALLRCTDTTTPWSCVPASFATNGIHRVLVVSVDPKPTDDGTSVLMLVGRLIMTNPDAAVVRQRFCEHCADDRLDAEASELARQMIREHAVRSGRTVIAIRSEPPGAQVVLDGERVGATNSSFNTYPGKHVLVLEKPGFVSETREVAAEEGRTAEIAVTLRSTSPRDDTTPPPRRSRLVPALLIGAGVAAVSTGIALQVTKDSPPLGESQPSRIYSAPGIGLAVAGGAIIGVGVYLWMRATSAPATTSAPAVTLVDGGGVIGWSHQY